MPDILTYEEAEYIRLRKRCSFECGMGNKERPRIRNEAVDKHLTLLIRTTFIYRFDRCGAA